MFSDVKVRRQEKDQNEVAYKQHNVVRLDFAFGGRNYIPVVRYNQKASEG